MHTSDASRAETIVGDPQLLCHADLAEANATALAGHETGTTSAGFCKNIEHTQRNHSFKLPQRPTCTSTCWDGEILSRGMAVEAMPSIKKAPAEVSPRALC